jgi:hypothetical protein
LAKHKICQVKFGKLLDMLLEVGKTQDLPSKIWQTVRDARRKKES